MPLSDEENLERRRAAKRAWKERNRDMVNTQKRIARERRDRLFAELKAYHDFALVQPEPNPTPVVVETPAPQTNAKQRRHERRKQAALDALDPMLALSASREAARKMELALALRRRFEGVATSVNSDFRASSDGYDTYAERLKRRRIDENCWQGARYE